jgi:peptidoglycan hydrolase-like protein with peptidoglycan-binding domain
VAGDNIPAAVLLFEAGVTVKPARPVLRVDAAGESVKELQTMLNALGFKCGKVDGKFGPRTLSAVRLFQTNNPPLIVDGVVGAATWAVLEEKAKAA